MKETGINILISHYLNDELEESEVVSLDQLIQQCAVALGDRYGCSQNAGRVRLYRALNDLKYFRNKIKDIPWMPEN